MKQFSQLATRIFQEAIQAYELRAAWTHPAQATPTPSTRSSMTSSARTGSTNAQWCLEDIIRDPEIDPVEALKIKRRIDRSNQERTDLVELIDSFFYTHFADVKPLPDAKINTESPAWAIDRLSILALKIYNMNKAVQQAGSDEALREKCASKLRTLREQEVDLTTAINELLEDIAAGRKYMKVYKQMKMYNDPELNPMLKGQTL